LSVVDHLIRYHYTDADFDSKEKEAIQSFSTYKAIRYYFDVIKLSSQNPINFTALALLLDEASEHLNKNAMSFIYFIFFWKQVANKAPFYFFLVNSADKSCLHKLLPFHQVELILHMFREKYVIDNWFIKDGRLITTGTILNDTQSKDLVSHYTSCDVLLTGIWE
jgi:hypothetical protein